MAPPLLDPLMILSLICLSAGFLLLGSGVGYLCAEASATGVWITPEEFEQWSAWKAHPKLGDGLAKKVMDSHAKDKIRISDLLVENDQSERMIAMLRGRIDLLVKQNATHFELGRLHAHTYDDWA